MGQQCIGIMMDKHFTIHSNLLENMYLSNMTALSPRTHVYLLSWYQVVVYQYVYEKSILNSSPLSMLLNICKENDIFNHNLSSQSNGFAKEFYLILFSSLYNFINGIFISVRSRSGGFNVTCEVIINSSLKISWIKRLPLRAGLHLHTSNDPFQFH